MTGFALRIVNKRFPHVAYVADAKRNVRIEVTQHDEFSSRRANHRECALAVACRRGMSADAALVSLSTVYIIRGNAATRYKLNEHAAREIISFDRGARFVPGVYQLRVPAPSERLGQNRPSGQKPARTRRVLHATRAVRTVLR